LVIKVVLPSEVRRCVFLFGYGTWLREELELEELKEKELELNEEEQLLEELKEELQELEEKL